MSVEANKAVTRRIPLEVFNDGNLGAADEVIAADFTEHVPMPGAPPGLAGFKQYVTMLRAAFPDLRYTVEDEIGEGDRVVARMTVRGTHRGAFLGVPPTGKRVTWTEMHAGRVVEGKLVEHWGNADMLGLLQQLGAIPGPDEAAPPGR
jgi:predicted ester cyclase